MHKESGSIGFGVTMMKRGNKVKRQIWNKDDYIYIDTSYKKLIVCKHTGDGETKWNISQQDLLADDYEIVK